MKEIAAPIREYRFLIALNVICATLLLMCHVVQNRAVLLGPTFATATIFVYPLTCWVLDIVAEVYGYKEARKMLWLAIFATFFFAIPVVISTHLPMPSFWNGYDKNYNIAMASILHTTIVSSIAIIVGQSVNIYVISKLRILVRGKFFALRSMSASIIGDTLTIGVALSGFFIGHMNKQEIITIVLTEIIMMYGYAILLAFPGSIIVGILKKIEPENPNNFFVNFNPFSKEEKINAKSVNETRI